MIPHPLAPAPDPAQPLPPPQLDDGFSPPAASAQTKDPTGAPAGQPVDPALWAKSDF